MEEIIDSLGSVVKVGSYLRSHNNHVESDVEYKLCSKNQR
jgi:hypothetical protein